MILFVTNIPRLPALSVLLTKMKVRNIAVIHTQCNFFYKYRFIKTVKI